MVKTIKKYIKKCKNNLIFYYFIIIAVILFPNALTMPSLSFKSAIVTAVGLDFIDNQIEVSVLTLSDISKDDTSEKTKVLSAKDINIANAIASIEFQIDRKVRMGHVGYVVVSKDIANYNVAQMLNNLIIASNLPKTVSVIMSEDKAKDVLNLANKLEHSSSFKLREIIQNEFNENYTKDSNLDLFLKGYFSHISTSTMGTIALSSNDDRGLNASEQTETNSSSDNSSSKTQSSNGRNNQSQQQEKSVINYKMEHAVFVDGKYKYTLSPEEMIGVNLLGENDLQQVITVNNINSQGLENASITFDVMNKKMQVFVTYRNNRPIIEYDMALNLNPIEITQEKQKRISPQELIIDEAINLEVNNVIKKYISVALQRLRQEQTDLINIYEILYNNNFEKLEDFLDMLDEKQEFLSYVQVKVKVAPKIMTN